MGQVFQPLLKSGKRSEKWAIRYYVNGRRVWERGLPSESEARRLLKEREGRVAVGAPVLPRLDKIRYEEAEADLRRHYEATESRDLGEYTYRVAHLTRFFAGRCIATLGKPDITAYIAARRQETARPRTRVAARVASGTIRKELTLLGTMLRLAYENKKLLHLPVIHKPEEGPARAGFFEPEQFDAVRRRLRPDLQVVVTIGHTYGWRKGEVLGLERRHVDLDAGTLRLDPGTTKNGEGRVVYLTPEAKHLLAEQLARVDALQKPLQRIIPFVFPHLSGRHRGQRIGGFQTAWENACKKAGVAGRLVHDLRRTAVRNMERNGVARSVATKMTGHKTESVYRRYAIVSDADLREAARKLTGAFSGRVGQISEKPVAEQVRI